MLGKCYGRQPHPFTPLNLDTEDVSSVLTEAKLSCCCLWNQWWHSIVDVKITAETALCLCVGLLHILLRIRINRNPLKRLLISLPLTDNSVGNPLVDVRVNSLLLEQLYCFLLSCFHCRSETLGVEFHLSRCAWLFSACTGCQQEPAHCGSKVKIIFLLVWGCCSSSFPSGSGFRGECFQLMWPVSPLKESYHLCRGI